MATTQSNSMQQDTFLRISCNLLYKVFTENTRTQAKKLFRQLESGHRVALTQLKLEDGGETRFDLSFNHQQFVGRINYTAFRNSLMSLLMNLNQQLENSEKVPVFTEENNDGNILFGTLGMTQDSEQLNVMVLGVNTDQPDATVELQLVYLEPSQFLQSS